MILRPSAIYDERERASEPTRFIYRYQEQCRTMPIEKQRLILERSRNGESVVAIAHDLRLEKKSVDIVVSRGVVFAIVAPDKPRCGRCGGKLAAVPCLYCEIAAMPRGKNK